MMLIWGIMMIGKNNLINKVMELTPAEAQAERRRLLEESMKRDFEKEGFIILYIGNKSYKFIGTWEENQQEITKLISEELEKSQKEMYKHWRFMRLSRRIWFGIALIFFLMQSLFLATAKDVPSALFAIFVACIWGFVLYSCYRDIQSEENP